MRTVHDLRHFIINMFQLSNINPKTGLTLIECKDDNGKFELLKRTCDIWRTIFFIVVVLINLQQLVLKINCFDHEVKKYRLKTASEYLFRTKPQASTNSCILIASLLVKNMLEVKFVLIKK